MRNTIAAALAGAGIWRRRIESWGDAPVLILPEYAPALMEALPEAAARYLAVWPSPGGVFAVCADPEFEKALKGREWCAECAVLDRRDMRRLMSYIALSAKHGGAPQRGNVKVIAADALSGGQLERIRARELFPLPVLIYDMLLLKE